MNDPIFEMDNDEKQLLAIGFVRHPEWDFETGTEHYRLIKGGKMFRALVCRCNGSVYIQLGMVVNEEKGLVKRWIDCGSKGSAHRKILVMLGKRIN